MSMTEPAYFTAFKYLGVTVRQRLSLRMAEAYQLGSALEGLTGADLTYQQR